jgi:hypothetical protein
MEGGREGGKEGGREGRREEQTFWGCVQLSRFFQDSAEER